MVLRLFFGLQEQTGSAILQIHIKIMFGVSAKDFQIFIKDCKRQKCVILQRSSDFYIVKSFQIRYNRTICIEGAFLIEEKGELCKEREKSCSA